MTSLFELLVTNRYILAVVTCLIGALTFYLKGYNQAKKQADFANQQAELNQLNRIQKTEAQNQAIDHQREQNAETVNATTTIAKLIELWNSFNQKPPSRKP